VVSTCLSLALAPRAARAEAPPAPAGTLCAATLNIWHDQQDWPARRAVMLDTLRALSPDVLFLQEVLQKEGLPNQARQLADSLGWAYVFASVDPRDSKKRYGNAILTRHRIVATHETKLAPLDDYRVAAHARLEIAGRSVDSYVTHLHHTAEGANIRARQVESLLAFIDSTRGKGALLIGGDFNAAPDQPELAPVHLRFVDSFAAVHPELADPGAGNAHAAGTQDSGDSAGGPATRGAEQRAVTTLNPAIGHAPRRIDYVFVEPQYLRPVAAAIFLDAPTATGVWASDHFGVWARFQSVEPGTR
jgi:endonuclease/exonuclease/phosphatase family metal-dependent hydrolase